MKQTSKIARLPHQLREDLNKRLLDNETAETLLPWLNEHPAAREILARHFKDAAITPQNLSRWRSTGFAAWQLRDELLDIVRGLAESSDGEKEFNTNELLDHLTTVLTARYLKLLTAWNGEVTKEFTQQVHILHLICRDLAQLKKLQTTPPHAPSPEPRAEPSSSSIILPSNGKPSPATDKQPSEPPVQPAEDDFDMQELEDLKQATQLLRTTLVNLKSNAKPSPNQPSTGVPVITTSANPA